MTEAYKIFRICPDTGQLTSAFGRTYRPGLHYRAGSPLTVVPDTAYFFAYESYKTAVAITMDYEYGSAMLSGVKLVLPVQILDEPRTERKVLKDDDLQSMPWMANILKCRSLIVLDDSTNRQRYYRDVMRHVLDRHCLSCRNESTVRHAFSQMGVSDE